MSLAWVAVIIMGVVFFLAAVINEKRLTDKQNCIDSLNKYIASLERTNKTNIELFKKQDDQIIEFKKYIESLAPREFNLKNASLQELEKFHKDTGYIKHLVQEEIDLRNFVGKDEVQ